MDLNEYQTAAARTANDDLGADMEMAVCGLGIAGEAGEVADLIKKVVGHGHPMTPATEERLVGELGDVLWYVARIAGRLGVGLEYVAKRNLQKLAARYPDGFSADRSINRDG